MDEGDQLLTTACQTVTLDGGSDDETAITALWDWIQEHAELEPRFLRSKEHKCLLNFARRPDGSFQVYYWGEYGEPVKWIGSPLYFVDWFKKTHGFELYLDTK